MGRFVRMAATVGLVGGAIGAPCAAAPVVHVSEVMEIRLVARPVRAGLVTPGREARLVIVGGDDAASRMVLAWPAGGGSSRLDLVGRAGEPSVDGEQALELRARLTLPDGHVVEALRTLRFVDRTTALFEVYRTADDSLTLGLEAEAEVVRRYSARPVPGAGVRFHVEIERVLDGRTILLETNDLDTFVGEPVTYSFRLGDRPDSESGKLTLRPLRVVGSMVEIEAEVDGAVLAADDLALVGRTERILATKETPTTLALESGKPPVGYRFRVTPRF